MRDYTVREVARMAGVTAKTLYHYQRVGLLSPAYIGENGYRYYGVKELEQLQQILYYRELDFSLSQIKRAMESEPNRLGCLREQHRLLEQSRKRTVRLLRALEEAIARAEKGEGMDTERMFQGFDGAQWEDQLAQRKAYLETNYGCRPVGNIHGDQGCSRVDEETVAFQAYMAGALELGKGPGDPEVRQAMAKHGTFCGMDAQRMAERARFFVTDDFHRSMLEAHQTGLSYYILACAEALLAEAEGRIQS